jgi:DNA-binding HxlR family transcriptional regulator
MSTDESQHPKKYSVEARWTKPLAERFCPVSSFYLHAYHRLRPHEGARGLNSSEALLIIHLIDFKWGEEAPWTTVPLLAKRMGLSPRQVRATLRSLEQLGYVQRAASMSGGPNRYHLDGLFRALEKLMAEDAAAKDEKEAA